MAALLVRGMSPLGETKMSRRFINGEFRDAFLVLGFRYYVYPTGTYTSTGKTEPLYLVMDEANINYFWFHDYKNPVNKFGRIDVPNLFDCDYNILFTWEQVSDWVSFRRPFVRSHSN